MISAVPAGADQACATNHIQVRLSGFSEGSVSRPLYWVAENGGSAKFTVQMLDVSCDGQTVSISYEVADGTATQPVDYSHLEQPVTFVNTAGHPTRVERSVDITNEFLPDTPAAVEFATITLTGMSGGTLVPPTSATLAIIDDDGLVPLVSFLEGEYEESESTPLGGVPVFRAGDASAPVSVTYTVTGGTATPGSDYESSGTGSLTFQAGDRMELIPITVVDDVQREGSESLQVSISGTAVDPQGTSTVPFKITDNEELLPPASTIHHPNQGKKYPASKFLIREIHIFTSDEGGAGTVAAEFALRRNMKNRSCGWWTGKKFKIGKCDAERWLKTDQYETDFFYIRMPELPPSVGTVKNYTAYSRAIDGAKNVEDSFEVGRNANTFEIKKKR
jgi:Calx-beta domain